MSELAETSDSVLSFFGGRQKIILRIQDATRTFIRSKNGFAAINSSAIERVERDLGFDPGSFAGLLGDAPTASDVEVFMKLCGRSTLDLQAVLGKAEISNGDRARLE